MFEKNYVNSNQRKVHVNDDTLPWHSIMFEEKHPDAESRKCVKHLKKSLEYS